jgi:branched-chain amino acid transport system permease protein
MMSWVKSGDLSSSSCWAASGAVRPALRRHRLFALEEFLKPCSTCCTAAGAVLAIVFGPMLVLVALYARGGIDSCWAAAMAEPLLSPTAWSRPAG